MNTPVNEPSNRHDTPRLHQLPIVAAFQLLAWLALRPSAWRTHLSRIAPDLAVDFCLAALPGSAWRNRELQSLLLLLHFLPTSLVGIGFGLTVLLSDWLTPLALWGWVLGSVMGIVFGAMVSVAAGAMVTVIAGLLFGLYFGTPGRLMIDLFSSADCALLFAMTSTITLYVTSNLSGRVFNAPLPRQLGSFVLGFLASLLAAAVIIAVILLLITARQANQVGGASVGPIIGVAICFLFSVAASWRARHWWRGLATGAVIGLITSVALGSSGHEYAHNPFDRELIVLYSFFAVLTYLLLFIFPYVLAERVAGTWAGTVAGVLGSLAFHPMVRYMVDFYTLGPQLFWGGAATLLGLLMPWWRPVLFYPLEAAWNTLLLRADERRGGARGNLLRWHAAFWDELQFLPFYGLDEHLVLLLERDAATGEIALEYINNGRQRWAARAAQIERDARWLAACTQVEEISHAHAGLAAGNLEGPASALLRRFSSISNDIAIGLAQISTYNQRLVLTAAERDISSLLLELTRTTDPYAQRFRPIAHQWRQIVSDTIRALTVKTELHQEIQNPYVVGVPLTKHQEIFVGRTDISAHIERLLQDQHHPPLLLYGQRRMGKTSLLYNLRWLLPNWIVPLIVDLQGPVALASDNAGFLYNLAKGIVFSAQQQGLTLTPLLRAALTQDPFTVFDDWLDSVEEALLAQGRRTILLALDEFEALDSALVRGRLSDEAVLGMLRHLIQHRERFKLLLAGSHTLDEFARWSGYLINAQMLQLSYLKTAEARQLIERPIKHFTLTYAPTASQRVLDLTRGHPYLVQLLCAEIVMVKNEQPLATRRYATVADIELAVPEMLLRGRQFFADIVHNQIDQAGLKVLQILAKQDKSQPMRLPQLADQVKLADQLPYTLDLLLRRQLIEMNGDAYQFQVEVIQRWFAQQ